MSAAGVAEARSAWRRAIALADARPARSTQMTQRGYA